MFQGERERERERERAGGREGETYCQTDYHGISRMADLVRQPAMFDWR